MPRGPKGEKRPADVIGNAVHVMRIATGEIEETPEPRAPPPSLGARAARRGRRLYTQASGGDCEEGRREAVAQD